MQAKKKWSQHVTQTSNALDLEKGVFTRSPRAIALSLKRSADASSRRKSERRKTFSERQSAFRSAMSMLNFYINRAGKSLPKERRAKLEQAKDELRKLYGRK